MDLFTNFLKSVTTYLPGVLGAIFVLLIGLLIASGARKILVRILKKALANNKFFSDNSLMDAIGNLVYYLIVLMVLMVVLEMMGVSNVLDPLKNMVNKFASFIPNIVGAGVIAYVGYILANLVAGFVSLSSSFFDKITEKVRLSSEINLLAIARQVVFLVIFIPILIAALDALNIEAISGPAKQMLNTLMNAIPNIIGAILIMTAFYFVAKYVSQLLKDILQSSNVDALAAKLNMNAIFGDAFSLSALIANIIFFFIIFAGLVASFEKLGLVQLTGILNLVMEISGKIAFGLAIIVLGTFASNLIFGALAKGENNQFMASIARVGAMSLFVAIGLRSMGIADEIVNLAFGLLLGAVAVAIAVSFGLGGRETAAKFWDDFYNRTKK
jgi:hypothetical protein